MIGEYGLTAGGLFSWCLVCVLFALMGLAFAALPLSGLVALWRRWRW